MSFEDLPPEAEEEPVVINPENLRRLGSCRLRTHCERIAALGTPKLALILILLG